MTSACVVANRHAGQRARAAAPIRGAQASQGRLNVTPFEESTVLRQRADRARRRTAVFARSSAPFPVVATRSRRQVRHPPWRRAVIVSEPSDMPAFAGGSYR